MKTKTKRRSRTYKVWIEVEEVDEHGDTIANLDLPFASAAVFGSAQKAVEFAEELQARAQDVIESLR